MARNRKRRGALPKEAPKVVRLREKRAWEEEAEESETQGEEKELRRHREHLGIRKIVLALLVIFAGVLLYIFKDDFNLHHLQEMFSFAEPAAREAVLTATDIVYESAASNQFGVCGSHEVVLTKSKLTVYDDTGAETLVVPVSMLTPALLCKGNYSLCYDRGEKRLMLTSESKVLFDKTFDYGIICADINESSGLAVVTADSNFKSVLTVYDKQYREMFQWVEADHYIVDASVNSSCTAVAAVFLGSASNDYRSAVHVFDLATGNRLTLDTADCGTVVSCGFRKDGSILVAGERGLRFFESNGSVLGSYSVGSKEITLMTTDGNETVLFLSGARDGSQSQLIRLDRKGAIAGTIPFEESAKSISVFEGNLAVLTDHMLCIFDQAGREVQRTDVSADMSLGIMKGKTSCVLFGMNRIFNYQ